MVPRRIVVIGTSGSGKSTMAGALASLSGAPHIELDSLYHGPNWTPAAPEVFAGRVGELAERPRWVFDGNYIDRVGHSLWPRADLIVWMDLPLTVILPRLVRRSLRRILHRTELWHGNREGWSALFGRYSVLGWAVRSHRRHRRELPVLLADLARGGVRVVRLRSAAQARDWLAAEVRADTPPVQS
ncbi:MAG TPA: hypothetical protein VFU43_27785 [Streptosporangiaceae bacterium]|nr:hypothetical protein [Streptosporangiaceae bacterium]